MDVLEMVKTSTCCFVASTNCFLIFFYSYSLVSLLFFLLDIAFEPRCWFAALLFPLCRRPPFLPVVYDADMELKEFGLLHNFPLLSFHEDPIRVSSDYSRLVPHSLNLTQHFPFLSVFFYSCPLPMALKQANMPGLVLCYFVLHQWCRKMIQDVTHRHQCSWPWNPCFAQCLCGLFSLLILDYSKGKEVLLRSVRMWSTSHVFPSCLPGKPIDYQWGTDALQSER